VSPELRRGVLQYSTWPCQSGLIPSKGSFLLLNRAFAFEQEANTNILLLLAIPLFTLLEARASGKIAKVGSN